MPGPAAMNGSEPMPGSSRCDGRPGSPDAADQLPHRSPALAACSSATQQVELVMVTKNPVDCCLYEIPLCVPACCEGQPAVREGRGIFGRGVVEYCWPCGFTAKVKFRPVLCDVKVDYGVN